MTERLYTAEIIWVAQVCDHCGVGELQNPRLNTDTSFAEIGFDHTCTHCGEVTRLKEQWPAQRMIKGELITD